MVSQALLDELKTIIKDDYGVELQPAMVSEVGNSFVNFFDSLAKHHYQNSEPTKGGDDLGNTYSS